MRGLITEADIAAAFKRMLYIDIFSLDWPTKKLVTNLMVLIYCGIFSTCGIGNFSIKIDLSIHYVITSI